MSQNNPRAVLLLIISMLAFLVGDIVLKKLLGTLPFWELLWLRTLCSMLAVLLFIIVTRRLHKLQVKKPFQHFLRGMFLAFISIFYYLSVEHFPLSLVATAFAGAPLVIAALSPLIFKEKATLKQWIATIIGFTGVCLILKPDLSQFNGFYLALLSLPFCYAGLVLWSKQLSVTENDWALSFYAFIPLLILSFYSALQVWQPLSTNQMLMIILTGASAACGFFLLVAAFRIGSPILIASFEYSAIVMALIADVVIWSFIPDYFIWLGIGLIATCGLMQIWSAYQQSDEESPTDTGLPRVTHHFRPEDTHTP